MPDLEKDIVPQVCSSLDEIERQIKGGDYMIKAPWSSSGKGILAIAESLGRKEKEWIGGILRRQGYMMLERRLNRQQDFAMEFKVGRGDVSFAGYSLFFTEGSGIYRGNYLWSNEDIEAELTKYVSVDYLHWIRDELVLFLRERVAKTYTGFVGVDMFVYEEQGTYRIDPVVEFNLRMTMGMVARTVYDRCVKKGVKGVFTIDHFPPGQLLGDHKIQMEENPIQIEDGRFEKGYFSLCPVTENTVYRAAIVLK
jgi:hypothetical protein